jgi:integrase
MQLPTMLGLFTGDPDHAEGGGLPIHVPEKQREKPLDIEPVGLRLAAAAIHFDAGGIDDQALHAQCREVPVNPEPVVPGFVTAHHPRVRAVLNQAPKSEASFHDFDEFERLVEVARSEALALLVVLLGGEAGLRCGEIMALEWTDIDFAKWQLTVARSEWKGHVTMPKGGRIRYVPMTRRLTEALREARHLRGPRVLCDGTGKPLTQKVIQVLVRRTARRARAIQELAGHQDLGTTQRYMHLSAAALDAAIRLLEAGTETSRAVVEK